MGADLLTDSRLGTNKQHLLVPLLRQSIYSRLGGYEDVNDAERLAVDPAMRHVVGGRAAQADNEAASTSVVGRFETEILSEPCNLTALMNLSSQWIDKAHQHQPLRELILDMDSSVSETYGEQEGAAYNGHFKCLCYHPLFLFNQFGDLEYAMLRRGNKASAKYWRKVLLPVIERYRHYDIPKFFRGDAAFANPALYRSLEKEGYHYTIRIKSNAVLEREIEHLLTRPVGRPSYKPKVFYHSFQYQAKSWRRARRVVAKIEWHAGELPSISALWLRLPGSRRLPAPDPQPHDAVRGSALPHRHDSTYADYGGCGQVGRAGASASFVPRVDVREPGYGREPDTAIRLSPHTPTFGARSRQQERPWIPAARARSTPSQSTPPQSTP